MQQTILSQELRVTKQTVNAWVKGKSVPSLETAFKIAKLLNCKVDDLFVYEE